MNIDLYYKILALSIRAPKKYRQAVSYFWYKYVQTIVVFKKKN